MLGRGHRDVVRREEGSFEAKRLHSSFYLKMSKNIINTNEIILIASLSIYSSHVRTHAVMGK